MTPEDLAGQIARLEAAWGPPKDRSPGQFVGMAGEWFRQLRHFGSRTVDAAITHAIGAHRFQWVGALPEVLAFCVRDNDGWRDALGLAPDDRHADDAPPFARAGRTHDEEIAHRIRVVAEAKRTSGFGTAEPIPGERVQREPVPASQDMTLSPMLLRTCAARRARNLSTCTPMCAKRDCELRRDEDAR